MDNKNDFALVRKPSSAVEKAAPGAKSILSGMVTDILAVAHVEDAKTLFIRGLTYYSDDGSAQDRVKAIKWFRKAAEHGLADAQSILGLCYAIGDGVPKDIAEAVKWHHKAAEQGNANAQNNLGACYEAGQGVPQDYNEAAKWFRKAADQGVTEAQDNLTNCYKKIVLAFNDFLPDTTLIGDCSLLPYPKKIIHYAIAAVIDDYETKRENTTNQTLRDEYNKMISNFGWLLTRLVHDWQEIEQEDKEAVAKLNSFDSFPDWALPLKLKYLDDERAIDEVLDMKIEVMKCKIEREKFGADF